MNYATQSNILAKRDLSMDEDLFIVYGRSSCPYCIIACNALSQRGLKHKFVDCESDKEFIHEAKMFYNMQTVPIVIHIPKDTGIVKMIGGCDDLMEFLKDVRI
ncbi:MAG: hypothetical protein CMB95_06930 [Flavobacteriaceae bacterium]|nr:hypothetical protein [Flavobacteriaceae bacterium]